MITSFFLNIFALFLSGLLSLLPSGSLPAAFSSSLSSVWGFVNAFSYVIAVDTLIQVVVLVIAFDLAVLLWHVLQWVIRKIPFIQ